MLPRIADLDLRAGRVDDAAAHLREGLQIAVRIGSWFDWFDLLWGLSQSGSLCAATGRAAEALTLWAACAALERHQGITDPSWFKPRREEQLRQVRQALGPRRARAAEDRGAAMSMTTAASWLGAGGAVWPESVSGACHGRRWDPTRSGDPCGRTPHGFHAVAPVTP